VNWADRAAPIGAATVRGSVAVRHIVREASSLADARGSASNGGIRNVQSPGAL